MASECADAVVVPAHPAFTYVAETAAAARAHRARMLRHPLPTMAEACWLVLLVYRRSFDPPSDMRRHPR